MNWDAIGAIGEIVGAAAVVASLLYVGVQTRRNTRETQTSNRLAITEMHGNWLAQFASNAELSAVLRRGISDAEELDADQAIRFDMAMFVQFDAIEAAYLQYRKGVLSEEDWTKWKNVLLNFMASPGGQNFWTKTKGNFTESFREVVETSEPVASYDYRGAI